MKKVSRTRLRFATPWQEGAETPCELDDSHAKTQRRKVYQADGMACRTEGTVYHAKRVARDMANFLIFSRVFLYFPNLQSPIFYLLSPISHLPCSAGGVA